METTTPNRRGLQIGTLLKARGLLTSSSLTRALDRQKIQGGRLGRILVDLGIVKEADIVLALHHQWHIPVIDFHRAPFDGSAVQLLPRIYCIEHLVLPVTFLRARDGGAILVVAMEDPSDHNRILEMHHMTGYSIKPMLAGRNEISGAIATVFQTLGLSA